jgi:hypothetical protein
MAEYLAPGVFLEEQDLKAPSIEGVSTSTTGMVGHASRGPTLGPPVLVTNMLQFRQRFGGPLPASTGSTGEMFYAAQGFFANGGRRLYVMRASGGGVPARFAAKGGFVTRLAPGSDAAVGSPTLRVASTLGIRGGSSLTLSFVEEGVTYSSSPRTITATGVNGATGDITLAALDINPVGKTTFPARSTAVATGFKRLDIDGVPVTAGTLNDSLTFVAADPGTWGNGITITSRHVSAGRAVAEALVVPGAQDNNQVRLKTITGFYPLAWVEIDRGPGEDKRIRQVLAINGNVVTLSGTPLATVAPAAPATETVVTVREFALTVSYDGVTETYPSLTLANVPGKYAVDQINGRSTIVRIDGLALPTGTDPFFFPSGADGLNLTATTAGTDVAPAAADVRGADNGPGQRSGLRALEEIEDISIIVAPGWGDTSVQAAMIEQCERLKYRVALLDPEVTGIPPTPPTLAQIQAQRLRFDSKYAAIYYPRIVIRDSDDLDRAIGPSGHMAGLCARIDNERGVFKSPGNEVIRNIVDVELVVTKGEHEILNPQPNNINVIRDFRNEGRGLRIYGARCITSLSDWKYLAVRRLFIFIERSIDIGTQWAVLEPNDQRLWDRLIDSVDGFLTGMWRDGALLGTEKAHAFYIRCGTSTMTQDDIDNGRLVMEVGIAPVKPAEFVIIRISQSASGSFATEA